VATLANAKNFVNTYGCNKNYMIIFNHVNLYLLDKLLKTIHNFHTHSTVSDEHETCTLAENLIIFIMNSIMFYCV